MIAPINAVLGQELRLQESDRIATLLASLRLHSGTDIETMSHKISGTLRRKAAEFLDTCALIQIESFRQHHSSSKRKVAKSPFQRRAFLSFEMKRRP